MKKDNTKMVLVLFLLGIFMGAIDSGIVSPAREIIQNGLGIDRSTGIWMITIYTLAYAISMPIVSKLADRMGHKKIYTAGIALFGMGSLLCGLSNFYGNFAFLLIARVIQAVGAGGIIPIATAVIGQSFPEEKRGKALGFVGMIYGVATIVGPTIGSALLNLFGTANWGVIFFINVPITIVILILSSQLPNTETAEPKPLDLKGALALAVTIGSLMYALTNLNFFDFVNTFTSVSVYPFLILAAVTLPFVVLLEKKAADPILNIEFFKSRQMVLVLLIAFIVGVGMMGMVFVPQFAENTLKIPSGTGGYLVTLLAIFSGIAAPLSGSLLDKKGAKMVLGMGFMFTFLGTMVLAFWAVPSLSVLSVVVGLAFMGFGVGFTMGAPLNYLVLSNVTKENGASGIATMSLMRSIGVAISPNIMIGFVVNAAKDIYPNLMDIIMPGGLEMGNSSTSIAPDVMQKITSADVTNIVDRLLEFMKAVIPASALKYAKPAVVAAKDQIQDVFQSTLNQGYYGMFLTTAVIAAIGFALTFGLKVKEKDSEQM